MQLTERRYCSLVLGCLKWKERKKERQDRTDMIQASSQPRHPSLLSEKSDKKSIIQFIQLNDQ